MVDPDDVEITAVVSDDDHTHEETSQLNMDQDFCLSPPPEPETKPESADSGKITAIHSSELETSPDKIYRDVPCLKFF